MSKCICAFCDSDFSHTKNPSINRRKHERRMHREEYERRKQTTHNCIECSNSTLYGKLYCSSSCRQRAKAVRYIRSVTKRGVQDRADIKKAINEKILWAFHGAYKALPREVADAVWERDECKCVKCGEEGDHVDHPQNSHNIDDAQLLCDSCHKVKTLESRRALDPTNPTDVEFILYIERIYEDSRTSTKPQHDSNWDWVTTKQKGGE